MPEETHLLIPAGTLSKGAVPYVLDFNGQQRQRAGVRYRLARSPLNGPVALKIAIGGLNSAQLEEAERRLRRELDVVTYLGNRGGELLSKCLGYNFTQPPISLVVTYRDRPLVEIAREKTNWPPRDAYRKKIIRDLLQGLELLRISRIVHGRISLDTLHWDGSTLQITDFGQAALCGKYPDGRDASHAEDVYQAGRVIYQLHTGAPPPDDPATLRQQLERIQGSELRDLLLNRDLVTGADVDYAFAEDHDRRPTAYVLLRRTEPKPVDDQRKRLVARDELVRASFRQLRERQWRFADAYLSWAAIRGLAQPAAADRPQGRQPMALPIARLSSRSRPVSIGAAILVGLAAVVLLFLGLR